MPDTTNLRSNSPLRTITSSYNADNYVRDNLGRATTIQNILGTFAGQQFTFHQSFANPLLQWESNDNRLSHRYLWSDSVDELLADEQFLAGMTAPNTKWALSDHQGTIKDIVDYNPATGVASVDRHRKYDPFGDRRGAALPTDIVFGYTGKYFDDVTGLQNNWNRWYDPKQGRFISQDPIGFAGGDENLYRYTGNSPTNRRDPSGLDWTWYKPWTWAEPWFGMAVPSESDWEPLYNEHDQVVSRLNERLGTSHKSIEDFPRSIVGNATDPRREYRRLLGEADTTLGASEVSLEVADKAMIAADILTLNPKRLVAESGEAIVKHGDEVAEIAVKNATVSGVLDDLGEGAIRGSTGLVPTGAQRLGKWGEDRLELLLGGAGTKPSKAFMTSDGPRYIDRLLNGIAHESKAGIDAKLTNSIWRQILKDKELIDKGVIEGAHWHFWNGATKELLDTLTANGIRFTVH